MMQTKRKIFFCLFVLMGIMTGFFTLAKEEVPSAIEYAPNLWFSSGEDYYPANPLDFYFENGTEISGERALEKYNSLSQEDKQKQMTVLYHLQDEGQTWVYQYWLFYVFNNYKKTIRNKHYGDWEGVFVFVDKESKEVIRVVGSAHVRKIFSTEINNPGISHIWTYIGEGSHANCIGIKKDELCPFFKWRKWEKWEPGYLSQYSDYELKEITSDFINSFGGTKTFEKSPSLGMDLFNYFHLSREKLYIFFSGKIPIYAWKQIAFDSLDKLRPISLNSVKEFLIKLFKD